ncbi:MAG: hypothetical protein K0Q55_3517 [Verrucomicrobia bacterium]|jgi:hypothetical protein|nr:hypothetical protein [Verrucomicrobiota bacterium]
MCCFSGNVSFVNNTRIFARAEDSIRQFIVYQMAFGAKEDLAMILPLPVRHGSGEEAVRFINLKDYPDFFTKLNSGFPVPRSFSFGCGSSERLPPPAAALTVQEVGNYEASFVPTVADFSRLDERFRLKDNVWKKLPAYERHGFAVFKLKSGEHESHPMAFSFPRRQVSSIFFPTVHIHDGEVHEKAEFDHSLYCQPAAGTKLELRNWTESNSLAKSFVDLNKSKGIVDGSQHCYRLSMQGKLNNVDVTLRSV